MVACVHRQRAFFDVACSTLLRVPILVPICPDVISYMNVRSDGHMMPVLERLRELAFLLWCLRLLVAWATIVFRKLASMLAVKRNISYSKCLFWLRCRLCFSLLRSAVMCLRGHPSSFNRPITSNIDLAYSEGCLESGGLN